MRQDGCVVDQDIDAAELCRAALDETPTLVRVGEVDDQPTRSRREGDLGDCRSTTGRDDVGPLAHRLFDEHATQGTGGTRDHDAEALTLVQGSPVKVIHARTRAPVAAEPTRRAYFARTPVA